MENIAAETVGQFIERTGDDWAARWLAARASRFAQENAKGKRGRGVASGNLKKSLDKKVEVAPTGSGVISLYFEDSGRYIDMKKLAHDKWGRNAITRLMEWAQTRGVENFKEGQLKKYGYWPKTEAQQLNKIAWGIARSKTDGKFKRIPWYARAKGGGISELYNRVAAGLPEVAAKEIKDSFKH